tara:strand:+ start:191 stop:382 length:192 start_codon:yes stop_codon:yes gene_type:complete
MLLVKNSNLKQIWIRTSWCTTLKNVGGRNAKKMNSGISIGLYHGVLRIFSILILDIEWAKHKY